MKDYHFDAISPENFRDDCALVFPEEIIREGEDGPELVCFSPNHAIVYLGKLVAVKGEFDVLGNQFTAPVMTLKDKVNVRVLNPDWIAELDRRIEAGDLDSLPNGSGITNPAPQTPQVRWA